VLFQECFPFLHPKSPKSPPWGIGKGKEKEKKRQREGEEKRGGGRERKSKDEDRKALDAEDGKFGKCGPIFNSGCQATHEQQGRTGWRAGEGPHWVTVQHVAQPKEGPFTENPGSNMLAHSSELVMGKRLHQIHTTDLN